ncbi:hypothetical protein D3C86_1748030 [compost metagenome]
MQRLLEFVLFHAGKEVERRIVVADMLEAEMVVLALAAMALGGAVLAGQRAPFPVAGVLDRRRFFFPAWFDANGVEELGLQFHCA